MKNKYYLAAGFILLFSAVLHTIGGQLTLVKPLLDSQLSGQVKAEWLGAWHLITILLFSMGYFIFRNGLRPRVEDHTILKMIYILCFLFSLSFIGASLWLVEHAPQYILFIPIAILTFLGWKKEAGLNRK